MATFRERRFNVGYMRYIFDFHKNYSKKSDAQEAAKRLNKQRYYTRITKVKHGYDLWKKKKPQWK